MSLVEAKAKIQAMLDQENMVVATARHQVTADYPSVLAEHRAGALRDVLKILEAIR